MKEYIVPLSEEEAFYGYKDMTTELIRCKDCIKKELCLIFRVDRQEYGFCAWAERTE